jgi:hypothetical protein
MAPDGLSKREDAEPPRLEDIQPEKTAPDDQPYEGDHPDNEVYLAIKRFARHHTDEVVELQDGGKVRKVMLDFKNEPGFGSEYTAEDLLNFDFELDGSDDLVSDAYGAILWPNGMVSLHNTQAELISKWNEVRSLGGTAVEMTEADHEQSKVRRNLRARYYNRLHKPRRVR